MLHRRRDFVLPEVGASKTDAEVGSGRLQVKMNLVAGVKSYSDTRNLTAKRSLCVH
jgi:hypothetical protein